jgi:hypothetical protein
LSDELACNGINSFAVHTQTKFHDTIVYNPYFRFISFHSFEGGNLGCDASEIIITLDEGGDDDDDVDGGETGEDGLLSVDGQAPLTTLMRDSNGCGSCRVQFFCRIKSRRSRTNDKDP